MAEKLKALLTSDRMLRIFCVGRLLSPVSIDLFALSGGFDAFWIDQEHVGLTWQEVQAAAVAGRANGLDSFVRMAPTNYAQVTQNLEAGTGGVMAAQINSAAHAEEFVRWAKFAPRGMRGMNTQGRDALYTHRAQLEFAEMANRDHLVAIQIETLGALAEVDQIAANDGVDLVFIGPADLSQSLGVQGQKHHPRVWEAYEQVAAACRKHGKPWGTVPADPPAAKRCVEMGCKMISVIADVPALKLGIQAALKAYEGCW